MTKKKASFPIAWGIGAVLAGSVLGFALGLLALALLTELGVQTVLSPWPTPTPMPLASPSASPTRLVEASATPTPPPAPSATPLPPEGQAWEIGRSVEGRALQVFRFGNGPLVRLVVGGIHGGYEANTVVLAELLIKDFQAGTLEVPDELTLYILPNLNPDGYANHPYQFAGRANANGVDLNRNWDSYWQPDWPRSGCFQRVPTTGGSEPFSEPEARALQDFLLANPVDAMLVYHSQMGAIFSHGSAPPLPAAVDLASVLAAASGYRYPPPDTGCLYTGQVVDWAIERNIAALTIELWTHSDPDLAINRKLIQAFLAWRRP